KTLRDAIVKFIIEHDEITSETPEENLPAAIVIANGWRNNKALRSAIIWHEFIHALFETNSTFNKRLLTLWNDFLNYHEKRAAGKIIRSIDPELYGDIGLAQLAHEIFAYFSDKARLESIAIEKGIIFDQSEEALVEKLNKKLLALSSDIIEKISRNYLKNPRWTKYELPINQESGSSPIKHDSKLPLRHPLAVFVMVSLNDIFEKTAKRKDRQRRSGSNNRGSRGGSMLVFVRAKGTSRNDVKASTFVVAEFLNGYQQEILSKIKDYIDAGSNRDSTNADSRTAANDSAQNSISAQFFEVHILFIPNKLGSSPINDAKSGSIRVSSARLCHLERTNASKGSYMFEILRPLPLHFAQGQGPQDDKLKNDFTKTNRLQLFIPNLQRTVPDILPGTKAGEANWNSTVAVIPLKASSAVSLGDFEAQNLIRDTITAVQIGHYNKLSSPRKRGSTTTKVLDSRFRGNDMN
ncbi:hypothetical protein KA005_12980, partial [bacterium]|nr:hypothetical protein [bacterium]